MTKFLIVLTSIFLLGACGNDVARNANAPANAANSANKANTANTALADTTAPTPNSDPLARGKQLYASSCANCHKEDGTGGPKVIEGKKIKAENLVSDKLKAWPDDRYFKVIDEGIEDEGMPAFGDRLSDDEIRAVIQYVRVGLQKKDPAAPSAANK